MEINYGGIWPDLALSVSGILFVVFKALYFLF